MKRKNYKVDALTLRRNVGRRVRYYRDQLSQRAFAKQLGITQAYLCRVERGEVDVSLSFLQKMLAAIETPAYRRHKIVTVTGESLSDFLKDIEDKDQGAYKWIKPEPEEPEEPTAEEDPLTPEEEAAEEAELERILRQHRAERVAKAAQQAAQAEREVSAEKLKEYMKRIISAGRKAAAKTARPDAGGSHEQMLDVNAAAEQLLQQINKA